MHWQAKSDLHVDAEQGLVSSAVLKSIKALAQKMGQETSFSRKLSRKDGDHAMHAVWSLSVLMDVII
jgi:hypothetical protein